MRKPLNLKFLVAWNWYVLHEGSARRLRLKMGEMDNKKKGIAHFKVYFKVSGKKGRYNEL